MGGEYQFSKDVYESIIDTLSEATSLVGKDYKYLFVNTAYCRLLNKQKDEIIGKYVWDVTGRDNFENTVKGHLDKALNGEKVEYLNKVELQGKPPTLYHLLMNYHPFTFPEGSDNVVLSTATDITEEVELKLHWKNTVNAIDDIIIIINKDLEIEDINNEGINYIGKPVDEIIGKKCYELIHNKNEPIANCPLLYSQKSKEKEHVLHLDERGGKWYSLKSSPVFDHKGNIERYVDVMRDVTTIIRQDVKINENEKLFQKTYDNAAVGLAHTRRDGTFFRVNKKFCEITGYSKEELLGKSFEDITFKDDLALDYQYYNTLLERKRDAYTMEKRYIHKSGMVFWVELNASVIRDESGEVLYGLAAVTDINDRKTLEYEIQQSREQLEISEKRLRAEIEKRELEK